MVDEIYFVVVMHKVDSVHEYSDTANPKIWVAAAAESYEDAVTFQTTLLPMLNHSDIATIIGANFTVGTGVVDIKAVLETGLN